MSKIITVFGATGSQGGSVVKTFLEDPKLKLQWAVRGVTRDPSSDRAQDLVSRGIEMVVADLNDEESLVAAMTGTSAVFAMTNTGNVHWDQRDVEVELQEGRNLADAAKAAGVEHYIWSSLPYAKKLTGGLLNRVYNFDTKAQVEEYIRRINIPASYFLPGSFMTNYTGGLLRPSPSHGGAYTLALPFSGDRSIALFDTVDTGKFVKAIIIHWEDVVGRHVLGTSGDVTGDEMIATFRKLFPEAGEGASWQRVDPEAWAAGIPGPDNMKGVMTDNMRLIDEFGYFLGESYELTRQVLEDRLTTWEEHLQKSPNFKDLK